MASKLFSGEADRFRGITVHSNVELCESSDLAKKLEESLDYWRENNKRTIWFKVYLEQSDWVPHLAKKGFKYHHAKEDYVMMYLWLPIDESNNIPAYAHTLVGVGGIVVNDKSQILVVREKYATRVFWKLPGGYAEPGENLVDTAIREVREETNITTEFQSVIAFRHTHGRVYNCSDIYVVVSLRPTSNDIQKSNQEISECLWMDIQEYLNHPEIHSLNKQLVQKYLEYKEKNIRISCESGVHQVLKVPYTFYSVEEDGDVAKEEIKS
ncbi:nudix hydrolase 8 isoform X2 [Coccinella septempunctata]|nr:nudix hydrolase 8 isoform X2 [Coccinella septempunctata]